MLRNKLHLVDIGWKVGFEQGPFINLCSSKNITHLLLGASRFDACPHTLVVMVPFELGLERIK